MALERCNKALIIGASFIGLEAAAALRARDIEVHVVAPERVPMERILGREMGKFLQSLTKNTESYFILMIAPCRSRSIE